MDKDDLITAAKTIYGEARSEPYEGMVAVAHVILNRAHRRRMTVQDVCLERKQFSCWDHNDPNLPVIQSVSDMNPVFQQCVKAMVEAMEGQDITSGATHYHTNKILPYWARGKRACFAVGRHLFYNNID